MFSGSPGAPLPGDKIEELVVRTLRCSASTPPVIFVHGRVQSFRGRHEKYDVEIIFPILKAAHEHCKKFIKMTEFTSHGTARPRAHVLTDFSPPQWRSKGPCRLLSAINRRLPDSGEGGLGAGPPREQGGPGGAAEGRARSQPRSSGCVHLGNRRSVALISATAAPACPVRPPGCPHPRGARVCSHGQGGCGRAAMGQVRGGRTPELSLVCDW